MIRRQLPAIFGVALLSVIAGGAVFAQQLPCNPVYQECAPTPGTPPDTDSPDPISLPGF